MSIRLGDVFAGGGFALAGIHQPVYSILQGALTERVESVPIYAQEWILGLTGSEWSFLFMIFTAGTVLTLRFFEIKVKRTEAKIRQIELDRLEDES